MTTLLGAIIIPNFQMRKLKRREASAFPSSHTQLASGQARIETQITFSLNLGFPRSRASEKAVYLRGDPSKHLADGVLGPASAKLPLETRPSSH